MKILTTRKGRRTALCALFVHDAMTALFAAYWFAGPDLVLGTAIWDGQDDMATAGKTDLHKGIPYRAFAAVDRERGFQQVVVGSSWSRG